MHQPITMKAHFMEDKYRKVTSAIGSTKLIMQNIRI